MCKTKQLYFSNGVLKNNRVGNIRSLTQNVPWQTSDENKIIEKPDLTTFTPGIKELFESTSKSDR